MFTISIKPSLIPFTSCVIMYPPLEPSSAKRSRPFVTKSPIGAKPSVAHCPNLAPRPSKIVPTPSPNSPNLSLKASRARLIVPSTSVTTAKFGGVKFGHSKVNLSGITGNAAGISFRASFIPDKSGVPISGKSSLGKSSAPPGSIPPSPSSSSLSPTSSS
ncbi:hypothetical protein D3C73_1152630 [compost metagenome]